MRATRAQADRQLYKRAIRQRLETDGVPPSPAMTRADTARFMQGELAKWVPIVRQTGARLD